MNSPPEAEPAEQELGGAPAKRKNPKFMGTNTKGVWSREVLLAFQGVGHIALPLPVPPALVWGELDGKAVVSSGPWSLEAAWRQIQLIYGEAQEARTRK